MRRFELLRITDVSGVSGTGLVAEGVEFSSGKVALCWYGEYRSMSFWDSIDSLEAVHGHEGSTKVVWIDSIN